MRLLLEGDVVGKGRCQLQLLRARLGRGLRRTPGRRRRRRILLESLFGGHVSSGGDPADYTRLQGVRHLEASRCGEGVARLRHLWEERCPDLIPCERHERQEQNAGAHEPPDPGQLAEAAYRRRASQRHCPEQAQPDDEGRPRLAVREHERGQRDEGESPADQPVAGERREQDEEETEQRPARRPRSRQRVDATGGEDRPARRQVEPGAELLDVGGPADCREPRTAGCARVRRQAQGAAPQLDSGRAALRVRRDQLILTADDSPAQVAGRQQVQAPSTVQGAGEVVPKRVAGAVQVQPDLAGELEAVRRRLGLPASHLAELQRGVGTEQERGQRAPRVGQLGARRIDRRRARQLHLTQRLVRLEHPDLALGPGERLVLGRLDTRRAQLGDRAVDARDYRHLEAPAANLNAQSSVGVEAGGQPAAHRHWRRTSEQHAVEPRLARLARNLQRQGRFHEERDAVADAPEHLDTQALPVLAPLGASAQPEHPAALAARRSDPATIDREIE